MSKLTRGKEFERKFWCLPDRLPKETLRSARHMDIIQGYLAIDPVQVRIRITDGASAVLELKGPNDTESDPQPLDLAFARDALDRFRVGEPVEKSRFIVPAPFKDRFWEIDFFKEGPNDGLVVIEIETASKRERLDPKLFPDWVGDEITGDPVFEGPMKNKNLALKPFSAWPKKLRALAEKKMRSTSRR